MDQPHIDRQIHIPPFTSLVSSPDLSIPEDLPPSPEPSVPFPQRSKRRYPCHLCIMDFTLFNNLSRHTRKVHHENPRDGVKCNLCNQCFENLKGLSVHMVAKHRSMMRRKDDEEDRCRKKRRLNQEEEQTEKTEVKDEDVKYPICCVESNPIVSPQTSKLEPLPQCLKTEETEVICSICHEELERNSAMEHLREHDDLADGLLGSFLERVTKLVTANVLMTLQVMGYIVRR